MNPKVFKAYFLGKKIPPPFKIIAEFVNQLFWLAMFSSG
tara:strand:+ start:447 stop:563 length:117 start_codon:yes stop_codon:yes gene_type:complete